MTRPKDDRLAGRCSRIRAFAYALALFASLLAAPWAHAADDDELPVRVGRVADVGGEVLLSPPDRPADWAPVGINYPVATGDNLWVGAEGRAEIDYGPGQFRLAGDTSVHVSRLEDRELALFVAQGRLIVRLRHLERGEVATVDTPNTQVALTRPGLYRIDVAADRSTTTVIVREGEALAAIVGGAQQILPGQAAMLAGPEPAFAEVRAGFGIDGFDAWNADRERVYRRSRAANYVSAQMPGWAELDQYGTWDAHPTYGAVWYPTVVAAGWAPYRFGRWAHTGRWGWTWVDDAPWGYAPSHYGRWAWIGGRWGWCPGAFVARPVWAPALVGWVGGSGWSLAITSGAPVYGWVPLGWGDPYVPWWGRGACGQRCWAQYNRPFAVPYVASRGDRPHVPATYSNGRVPGAVSAVAAATLAAQRPVGTNLVAVPAGVQHAPVQAGAPPVKPLRLPETRPVGNAPAPASTFYPSARPRHPANPPVSPTPPADPGRQPGTSRPSTAVRPVPAQPPAAQPGAPSGARPSVGLPPTSAPPSTARPMAPPPTSAPPSSSPAATVRPSAGAAATRPGFVQPPGPGSAAPPTAARPSGAGSTPGTSTLTPPPGAGAESRPSSSRAPSYVAGPRGESPSARTVPQAVPQPPRAPASMAAPATPSAPAQAPQGAAAGHGGQATRGAGTPGADAHGAPRGAGRADHGQGSGKGPPESGAPAPGR